MRCRLALLAAALATMVAAPVGALADRLAYRVASEGNARVTKNVEYRTLAPGTSLSDFGSALSYDVYRPAGTDATPRPALVFVPGGIVPGGGGPLPKDWPSYVERGQLAAALGLVGVVVTHRMTIRDSVAEAAGDLAAALDHVRANAGEHGIDPDRIAVAIYSAGGPLSARLIADPKPWLKALVLYYPFLDLEHMRHESPFRAAHPKAYVDGLDPHHSPRAALAAGGERVPPLFVARAGKDAILGLNASIERFMAEAIRLETNLEFHLHRTGAHGFDVEKSDRLDPRAREIGRAAMDFVLRHLERGAAPEPAP